MFRKKKIYRKFFFECSKKFRRKKFNLEVNIFTPESKNNFEIEIILNKEFLRYYVISRSNKLRGIQKTWSGDHRTYP